MPDGDSSLAQAIYLAQLFAARGTCNCRTCYLLRKVSADMEAEFLAGQDMSIPAKQKTQTQGRNKPSSRRKDAGS